MTTAILLLAAGASRRFGPENKLLQPLDGRPLLRHAADAARAVPAEAHIAVVSDPEVQALVPDFRRVMVDPGLPQSESLKAGIAVAQALGADQVVVVLGDMPRVTTGLIKDVLAHGRAGAAAASDGTRSMPPALLPAALFPSVTALTGDHGAGALLRDLPPGQLVRVAPGLLADVDLPDDLTALETR